MSKYCPSCNGLLEDGAKFCGNCGAVINNETVDAIPVQEIPNGAPVNVIEPGFSDRVNDPEILAAVKKNRKAAGIFALIIVPLPLIAFVIYSLVSDKMETPDAVKYGAIVSAIFLLFAVVTLIKNRAANSYEGVVIEKKSRQRSDNDENHDSYYTEYITYVKTTDGKKKKIRETDRTQSHAWDYLDIGDRFRYHPQFNFPYELYDKSKAPYIVCVGCGKRNSPYADRCEKCNIPLLK
ncbi:MAG: zinc ribbon domain-containing protein [Eubacterium sp.]|nr:zinc ribbon domain-containing protein [Eubacterium sp.]